MYIGTKRTFNGIKHIGFWGGVFSNFQPMDPYIGVDGHTFYNSEQEFMYLKAKEFGDGASANKILKEGYNPKMAKKIGRKVVGFDDEEWAKVRLERMRTAVTHKFASSEDLTKALLGTGDAVLVEASPYDRIWGIGVGLEEWEDQSLWCGQNLLGITLMNVREEIRNGQ